MRMYIHKDVKTGRWILEGKYKKRFHIVAKMYDENGDFLKYAESRPEAEECFFAHIEKLKNNDKSKKLNKGKVFLEELISMYIEHCDVENIKTTKTYCNYLLTFIKELYGEDIPIDKITKLDIIKYRKWRLAQPITVKTKEGRKEIGRYPKESTINREINTLQGMFTWAIEDAEILEKNPCSKLGKLQEQNISKKAIVDKQESEMFESIKGTKLYPIILFFNQTGARLSEVLESLWANIHFETVGVFKFGYIDILDTKTGFPRRIPMSEELHKELAKLPRLSEFVFTNPGTGTRYKNIRKSVKTILKKIGAYELGVGFHIFRHTFARKCEEAGGTTTDIQELLGHTDRQTTQNYLSSDEGRKQQLINKHCERTRLNINACE